VLTAITIISRRGQDQAENGNPSGDVAEVTLAP